MPQVVYCCPSHSKASIVKPPLCRGFIYSKAPSIEGASWGPIRKPPKGFVKHLPIEGLCTAPIERGFPKAPIESELCMDIHTHTSVFFPTDMGMLHYEGFAKFIYRRGFTKPWGAFLWGLYEAPSKRGFIYSKAPL